MTERLRSESYSNIDYKPKKMGEDLGPGKTLVILVIVIGCFAVLCPNVFYPMLFGSSQNHIKPSSVDRTTGCCDVISEIDINTLQIMSELCSTIIKKGDNAEFTAREIVSQCQKAVLETCGIDISAVLQERVILGHTTKQILDEIRSLNGSLCLKYNFGVSPWRLGVPHRVTVNVASTPSIRQERPSHLRSEMVHPAFRERGRAIPTQQPSPSRPPPRIIEGKPGPIPGMRPTIGGAGKVVPPSKQTTGTMGLIMPIYTIGIVILFTYTVMKVLFKKQQESLYPPVEPDPVFRREVFEQNRGHSSTYAREPSSNKLGWMERDARDIELDQLRRRLRETEAAMERIVEQMAKVPLKMQDVTANGNIISQEDQGSVKVLGMEMTASCEGNKKWSCPDSPALPPPTVHPTPAQPSEPPQEIYLEGSLPPQSNHLLVADSATEAQKINTEEDPAVVLAGKMTLSVLSLDSENGNGEFDKKAEDRSSSNVSEDFEKIDSGDILGDNLNEDLSLDGFNGSISKIEDNLGTFELMQNQVSDDDLFSTKRNEANESSKIDDIIQTQLELNDPVYTSVLSSDLADSIKEDAAYIMDENEAEVNEILADKAIVIETQLSPETHDLEFEGLESVQTQLETQNVGLSGSIEEIDNVTILENVTEVLNKETQLVEGEQNKDGNINSIHEIEMKKAYEGEKTNNLEVLEMNKHLYDEEQQRLDQGLIETKQLIAEEISDIESNLHPIQTSNELFNDPIQQKVKLDQELSTLKQLEVDEIKSVDKSLDNIGAKTPHSPQTIEFQIPEAIKENISEETCPTGGALNISAYEEISKPVMSLTNITESDYSVDHTDLLGMQNDPNISITRVIKNIDSEPLQASNVITPTDSNQNKIEETNLGDSSKQCPAASTAPPVNFDESSKGLILLPDTNLNNKDENISQSDESIDGEEVEYEYEISEGEKIDEEIQNIDRLEDMEEEINSKLNGDEPEQVKDGATTSNDTLAENIISDEEVLNDDEEIIEYVTDEEDIIEEHNQPQNGINGHNTTGAN